MNRHVVGLHSNPHLTPKVNISDRFEIDDILGFALWVLRSFLFHSISTPIFFFLKKITTVFCGKGIENLHLKGIL